MVLPSYAEASNLKQLLPALNDIAAGLTESFEIIVVDSAKSRDDTFEVCHANNVTYILRAGGDRYGDAVRTGIDNATGTHILFMDADGSHDPRDIAALWHKREQFDIVIGSRYVHGGHTDNQPVLVAMSVLLNSVFRGLLKLNVKDLTNSFRLYRRPVLDRVSLVSNDFDILEEILVKCLMAGASVAEVPTTFRVRASGKSKRRLGSFLLSYLTTTIRLRTGSHKPKECPEAK